MFSIGGIQISTESLNQLAVALAFILFGHGLLMRANAKKIEANAKKIEANAKEIEANANKINADATIAKAEAEATAAERLSITQTLSQYSALLQQQITINSQAKERADQQEAIYQKRLLEKEQQDENNYRTLSQTQDRHAAEIQTQLKHRFDLVDRKLDELPNKLQDNSKEWLQTVIGELVTQLSERFAEFTMAQEWYPFPDMNDPEWREEFVKPLVGKVRLYRRPVLSETSVTDALIVVTGETMEIIQGRKKGWLIVRLQRNAKVLYGWLPEHEVLTGLNAVKLATNEVPVVQPSPALNPT